MAVITSIDNLEGMPSLATVYKWFEYLKSKDHNVKGYVIMPNHLHVLTDFKNTSKSINTIVSEGKKFIPACRQVPAVEY